MSAGFDWVIEPTHDFLSLPFTPVLGNPAITILPKGKTGDGHFVPRHEAKFDQVMNYARYPSDAVDVLHQVFAAWFQVGKEWNAVRY